jgi:hypothetical protein
MSNRLVALALLIAFLPACATRAEAKLGGGILALGSVVAVATGAGSIVEGRSCETDPEDDCDTMGLLYVMGAVLIAGGTLLGLGAGAVWTSADDETEDARIQVAPRPAPPPAPTPTPRAVVGLPARATDDTTLRLARQAARAASLRQCSAARVTLREIAARDAAYHAELTATPAVAACL